MSKKKQFAPHIYPEWGELFANLSDKQNAEILKAITQFPNYEPENNPIWNFIKSQIEKDYEIFVEKCNKNESIIRNYWQKKKSNDNECKRTNTNENECLPKRITNNEITYNELRITETEPEIETTKIKKIKINDPYQNEYIKHYEDCYKKIIGCNNCYLLQMHRDKLNEIAEELGEEYFKAVETVLKRLKKLNFDKLGIKPNTTWLLKNDNFIKVLEGTFTEEKEISPYDIGEYNAFA